MGNKKRSSLPIILLILIVLVSAGIYAEVSSGLISDAFSMSKRIFVPEDTTFIYDSYATPSFSRGKDGFLCVTKDGAVYHSFKGETVWGVTYSMQNPYVIKSGENWVILEPMGRAAYVCGQEGLLYIATPEHPILNAGLNRIDCLALLLKSNDGYIIRVYNGNGSQSFSKIHAIEGVYPTCAALSDDGYMLTVSYLDTTKASLSSRIMYFYTDSGAKRYGTDERTPFKAIEKPGAIVTKLVYGKNGNLVSVSDNEIFITTQRGDEVLTYPVKNQLDSYSFNDETFGVVLGRPFANTDGSVPAGRAEWFDYTGKKLYEYQDAKTSEISVYDKFVLLKSGQSNILVDNDGNDIWTYEAQEDIISVIPIDKRRAVFARPGMAQVHSLKMPKGGGEEP